MKEWLFGYVVISVTGKELTRLIRLCSKQGISLWNVKAVTFDEMEVSLFAKDFLRIKAYVKKTKSHIRIKKKQGLFFELNKRKNKWIYGIGMAISFFALVSSSCFVWKFHFVGNSYISEQQLEEFFQRNHCGIGTWKHNIEAERLEKIMRKEFPDIIWNSISVQGTTIEVLIKERMKNDVWEGKKRTYYDLIAPMDGQIVSCYVRGGTAAVEVMEQVKKGDPVVYGWIPIYDDANTKVLRIEEKTADADVLVKGEVSFSHKEMRAYQKKIYTGREREYAYLGSNKSGWDVIPYLYGKQKQTVLTKTETITLLDIVPLPFYLHKTTQREFYYKKDNYTNKELLQRQEKYCQQFMKKMEQKGVQILGKNVMITYGKKDCEVKGTIECIAPAKEYVLSRPEGIENIEKVEQ